MKDPLQTQPTPYEILSVSPGATAEEIDQAFKKGLGKSKNVKQKQDARQFLLNRPLDRALLNLFLYDDAVLEKLDPNPLNDLGALDVSRRAETARKWRKQFRGSTFPDPGIAHALGILWYWSACQASEQFAETGEQSDGNIPAWQDSWESAIGYWAFVTTTPDFWAEKSPPSSLTQDDIRAGVQQRIASDLHRFTQLQRDAGHDDAVDRFQQLEMDLTRELETAKTLLDAKARINEKFLCFGNLMLVRMRLVEQIVAYIDKRLRNPPPNATEEHLDLLRKFKEDLSSYGNIAALIKNGRFDAAINQIESLPPNERELPEVLGFEAQARFQFGQQLASVNKFDEALACWERALQCAQSDNLRREIAEAAESACINASAPTQPLDEAIRVFESGLRITPHSEKLRLRLADLLTQRGIQAVSEAKKKTEKEDPPSEETLGMVERGIADLRRAKELGSERAAEQLKAALEVEVEISLPRDIRKLLEEANEAAGRQDWNRAIEKLRKILRELALKRPAVKASNQTRKNLAICLTQDGINRANVADTALALLAAASAVDLAAVLSTLESFSIARSKLCEAVQLDPSSEHILKNLQSLEGNILQLKSKIPEQFRPPQELPISAGTLKLLQEAYAALENEDWDQAADKFEKAIKQIGSQASEHLPREFPISAEAQQLLDEAYVAREHKDWDNAIEKFKKAINRLGSRVPEQAKKDLADLLAQRGVNRQNEVMQTDLDRQSRIEQLYRARDDLFQATQLDPSNDSIVKRLRYIEKTIETLDPKKPQPKPQPKSAQLKSTPKSAQKSTPQPQPPQLPILIPDELKRLIDKFTIKPWALIVFHLFIAFLAFGVASYDRGSLFFYETHSHPDSWLFALRGGSIFGQLAVSSATLVCIIGIFLLIFTNWFSWKNKLSKVTFFILPEAILGGWLAVFSLGLVYMPSTGSDQKGLSSRVAMGSAVTASTRTSIPEKPVPKTPMEPHQQLSNQSLVVDQVTTALMRLDRMAADPVGDQRLRTEISVLQNQLPLFSKETCSATTFLIAAALEKLDPKAALSYYAKLIQARGLYIITGKIRKSELEATDPDQLEKVYKEALEKPATEGWFRTAGSWERTTTHRAASLGLVDLRRDRISIRILDWLRAKSLFPLPYAYLFALIALALTAKLVELPFLVATARIHTILKPRIEQIRQEAADDSAKRNSQIAELYKNHGTSDVFSMLHWFIDIAFAIWIVLSLRAWAPQMELDGAKFFWIMNIFKPSHSLLVVWIVAGLFFIGLLMREKLTGDPDDPLVMSMAGSMSLLFIIPAIAWFFNWPAYMTIAWMLLWGLSAGIQLILIKLAPGRFSRSLPPKADFVCGTS